MNDIFGNVNEENDKRVNSGHLLLQKKRPKHAG